MDYERTIGYAEGVDFFKQRGQDIARATADNIKHSGFRVMEESIGESVLLLHAGNFILATVVEGLGTENEAARLAALQYSQHDERSFMREIGRSAAAVGLNDLAMCGARPLVVGSFIAAGSPQWAQNRADTERYLEGWRDACDIVNCTSGGGETQTHNLLPPEAAILGCAPVGIIHPLKRYIRGNIEPGDAIIIVGSNGVHDNGFTAFRAIAEKLPRGYLTDIGNGQTYAEGLLGQPTLLIEPLIRAALNEGVEIHYVTSITGHGWRKLMRAKTPQPLHYVVKRVPQPQPIFAFLQRQLAYSDKSMFGNFNMGAGFAFIVPRHHYNVELLCDIANRLSATSQHKHQIFRIIDAGSVESGPENRVTIRRDGMPYISWGPEELTIR